MAAAPAAAQVTEAGSLNSVAGGGGTVAALNHAGVADSFSYISAAGGAFLEWMEGKDLPRAWRWNGSRHTGKSPKMPKKTA